MVRGTFSSYDGERPEKIKSETHFPKRRLLHNQLCRQRSEFVNPVRSGRGSGSGDESVAENFLRITKIDQLLSN